MKTRTTTDLNTALFNAINFRNYELALELIDQGAELNPQDGVYTVLNCAIWMASDKQGQEFVSKVIELGCEINPRTVAETPLVAAIRMNSDGSKDKLIELLISKGAEINPISDKVDSTPLMAAIGTRSIKLVNKCLELGADVNHFGAYSTPLLTAIDQYSPEIFSIILDKTDLTRKLPVSCHTTYLMSAFRASSDEVIQTLLNTEGIDIHSGDSFSQDTPLYLAIIQNRYDVAKQLLEMGARTNHDITVTDQEMIELVKQYEPETNIKMFQPFATSTFSPYDFQPIATQPISVEFVNAEMPLEQSVAEKSNSQKLIEAIFNKDLEAVKEIVAQEGVDIINHCDSTNSGISPLFQAFFHTSASTPSSVILDYLLNIEGVDLNMTHYGSSLLELALNMPNQVVAEKLIQLGANKVVLSDNFALRHDNKLLVDYVCNTVQKASDIINLLNEAAVDKGLVLSMLKNIINEGHRPTLQAVVTKGGQDLLKIINDSGEFKEIKKVFMKYGIKYSAKYHNEMQDFVITSTYHQDESDKLPANNPEVKEKSKTYFKDGKVYSAQTGQIIEKIQWAAYVISKTGKLYTNINDSNIGHHSFFLKGKPGDDLYGYGKPVACGGHISIEDGKITELSASSGHYTPTIDQMKVVAHYLAGQGVLDENSDLSWYDQDAGKGLFSDITSDVIGQILDQYTEVNY